MPVPSRTRSILRRAIPGISQRMLTVTLRSLERDGLVSRRSCAETPPRVEYAVTDLGPADRLPGPPGLNVAGSPALAAATTGRPPVAGFKMGS